MIALRSIIISIGVVVLLSIIPGSSLHAEYVLPYPGVMPGNKIYKITRLIDTLQGYWSWGSIAQLRYHLSLSDKYLVEAKTLSEYNQYLLAVQALERSDIQFNQLRTHLVSGIKENKDMTMYGEMIVNAASKHQFVLEQLLTAVPSSFQWTPEKQESTQLELHDVIRTSIELRVSTSTYIKAFMNCVRMVSSEHSISDSAMVCNEQKSLDIPLEEDVPNLDSTDKDEEPYL